MVRAAIGAARSSLRCTEFLDYTPGGSPRPADSFTDTSPADGTGPRLTRRLMTDDDMEGHADGTMDGMDIPRRSWQQGTDWRFCSDMVRNRRVAQYSTPVVSRIAMRA
jgi:hypothetical protein